MSLGQFIVLHGWKLASMLILLGGSAFLSAAETALFTLTRGQLHRMKSAGGARGLAAALMRHPRRALNTILLANMILLTGYTGISATLILHVRPVAGVIGSALSVLALIFFAELAPKMLGFYLRERLAAAAAAPLALIQRLLAPPLWVLDTLLIRPLTYIAAPRPAGRADVTPDELEALVAISAKRGLIDRDAGSMLREIVGLTDLHVSDIMVPRVDIDAYEVNGSPQGLLELFRRTGRKKLTIYERNLDNVLGILHAKRLLLNPQVPLRQMVVKTPFVPETANLERVLLQFRVTRTQTAYVVDEYGGTAGLVTLEDVVREIVGGISGAEAQDRGPVVQRVGEREYVLDADLAIHEWAEAFKMDLRGRRISTLGGFVISLLGRVPKVGDTARHRNLRFTIESMRGRRVGKVRVHLLEGLE